MGNASPAEMLQSHMSGQTTVPLYQNTFVDARQTLIHIARNFERGISVNILQDKESTEAICIRVC